LLLAQRTLALGVAVAQLLPCHPPSRHRRPRRAGVSVAPAAVRQAAVCQAHSRHHGGNRKEPSICFASDRQAVRTVDRREEVGRCFRSTVSGNMPPLPFPLFPKRLYRPAASPPTAAEQLWPQVGAAEGVILRGGYAGHVDFLGRQAMSPFLCAGVASTTLMVTGCQLGVPWIRQPPLSQLPPPIQQWCL